jgi:hypothetical protein
MAAANLDSSKTTESPVDPRESGTQLRPGLWQTINERYPGSMITKRAFVPLARLAKALKDSTVCLISSCPLLALPYKYLLKHLVQGLRPCARAALAVMCRIVSRLIMKGHAAR